MRKILTTVCAFFALAASVFAQTPEHLVPLSYNPQQAEDAAVRARQRSANSFYDTIPLPTAGIREKFDYDSHTADDSLWDYFSTSPATRGAFVNRTWAIAPPNIGVCTFDGLNVLGVPYDSVASVNSTGPCDQLTSLPIDLSTYAVADSVYLSFWYQPKGRGYAPNPLDSFILDFNTPSWNPNQSTTVWKTIWFSEGYTPSGADTGFHIVMIKLDSASYFAKGFKFRFRNYASRCGSNDHWHLDEVYLKKGRTLNDTLIKEASFVYQMPSFLKSYRSMPFEHYKPSLHMANDVNVQIRNNDIVARNIAYTYDVYDAFGALQFHYNGGSDNLLPYEDVGYSQHQPHANPDVYPSQYLSGFPQNALDTNSYYIRHKLADGSRTDSADFYQRFYNYYAYDDGTAETGYGLYGANSMLAYKFVNESSNPDTLTSIQMYFLPVLDIDDLRYREFNLVVWADGGNQPGTVIYRQRNQHIDFKFEGPDRFVTYTIDSGLVSLVGGQTFYIGWEQLSVDRLYIGFDFNNNNSSKIFYNSSGNWNNSIFEGSLMMRPVFGEMGDLSGVNENARPNSSVSVYPNPANSSVTVSVKNNQEQVSVSVLDISGRELMQTSFTGEQTQLNISELPAGMYFVRIVSENGEQIGIQRLVVSE